MIIALKENFPFMDIQYIKIPKNFYSSYMYVLKIIYWH